MNVLVAKVIKDLLIDLPYFDRAAGLVQVITKEDRLNNGDGKGRTIRFPIEVDVTEEKQSIPLIPDDSIKGMFYLEDGGSRHDGNSDWTSDLTLVCWICPKKISANTEAVSASIIADILVAFKPFHSEGPITRLKLNVVNNQVRSAGIFGAYTYPEVNTQYLMPPYDFFALKIKASYRISSACLSPLKQRETC